MAKFVSFIPRQPPGGYLTGISLDLPVEAIAVLAVSIFCIVMLVFVHEKRKTEPNVDGRINDIVDGDDREAGEELFSEKIVKEVMTPRPDVTAVSSETTIEEAISECIRSHHSRLPVFEGDLDSIVGVVHLQELVGEERKSGRVDTVSSTVMHVPETKQVSELLSEMQAERRDMVIVVDEFGTVEGLVTIEDIVELVDGEILEVTEQQSFV